MGSDIFLYPAGEFRQVFLAQGQSGGVDVSAEVLEQVGTVFYRIIEVEALDAAGRTGHEAVGPGEHEGRLVVLLHQPGSHDADHSLVPVRIVHYGCVPEGQAFSRSDHLQRLTGDLPVDVLQDVPVPVAEAVDALLDVPHEQVGTARREALQQEHLEVFPLQFRGVLELVNHDVAEERAHPFEDEGSIASLYEPVE